MTSFLEYRASGIHRKPRHRGLNAIGIHTIKGFAVVES